MAGIYTGENVPLDVLTSYDAGNANARVPDNLVLKYANSIGRTMVTNNRRDFIRLRRQGAPDVGIVVFTFHPDPMETANRISKALADERVAGRFLARVDGVSFTFDPT